MPLSFYKIFLRAPREFYGVAADHIGSEKGAEIQQIKKISKEAPERVPALIYL